MYRVTAIHRRAVQPAGRFVSRTQCCAAKVSADLGDPECVACGCPFPRLMTLDRKSDAHLLEA